MPRYLTIMIGPLMIADSANQLLSAEHSTATLSPVQELFVSGEPIDLVLTLHNEADVPVSIPAHHYPGFFGDYYKGGITLTAKGRVLNTAHDRDVVNPRDGRPGLPHGPALTWVPDRMTRGPERI